MGVLYIGTLLVTMFENSIKVFHDNVFSFPVNILVEKRARRWRNFLFIAKIEI